jgi:hypothetical protein
MVNLLSFHNSSFALRYFFNVNGKATVVTHSLFHNCTRKGQSLFTRKEDNIMYMGGVLKSSLRLGQCGVLYMCVCACVCGI